MTFLPVEGLWFHGLDLHIRLFNSGIPIPRLASQPSSPLLQILVTILLETIPRATQSGRERLISIDVASQPGMLNSRSSFHRSGGASELMIKAMV